MSTRRPFRSLVLLSGLTLLPLAPGDLLGQENEKGGDDPPMQLLDETDETPPEVHIVPEGGTFEDSLLNVTVYWCDNQSLDAGSRSIKKKFTNYTSSFSWESVGFAEPCNDQTVTYKSEGVVNINTPFPLVASIEDDAENSGDDSATYTYEPYVPPTVWTSPMNEGYRNTALEAASGFETVLSHTTPGYRFKGARRNLTFVYRSGSVSPKALVQVNVSAAGADPDQFSMKVKDPSGAFMTLVSNDSTELFWDGSQSMVRLGGVVDASSLGTGVHELTVIIRSHFSGQPPEETVKTVDVIVVDESSSPYGEGWSIAGIQKAHVQSDSSVLITEGDGSAAYFEKSGGSWSAPNGDFSELDTYAGGWKRTYPNGDEVEFNSGGEMTKFTPLYGAADNSVSYSYSGGKLTHLDPFGSGAISTTLAYAGDSIVVEEGYATGAGVTRKTVVHHNGSGRVTSIVGPDGEDELGVSYTDGLVSAVTNRRGFTTDFTYGYLGYLESVELPEIDVDGQDVRPELEQRALARIISPDTASGTSGSPATPVTVANAKAWVADAKGAKTYFTLDPFGAPLVVEEPLGRTTTITRNSHSQVTRVDRPSGAYSTTSWSGPRMTGTHESTTGHTVQYEYASPPSSNFNQPVRVHDNEGSREIWYEYDANDRLEAVYFDTIGGPLLAGYTYRPDGQLLTSTDSDTGHLVKYEYDTDLQYENVKTVHRIRGTDTLTTRFDSDDYGRLVKTINAAGDSSYLAYDDLDRPAWSANALGDTTWFASYDGYLLDSLVNARGKSHTTTYNALGWATSSTDPEGGTSYAGYDENGNVIFAEDRLENQATFGYDSLNLPTFREVEGDTIHIWVDPEGLASAVRNAASIDTTEYDTMGRVTRQITRRGATFSRRYIVRATYDDDGPRNRVWVSSPGSIDYDMRYVWNDQGQLTKLSDHVPGTPVHTEFVYNDHHQLDSVKVGGTTGWSYTHSSFHPLASLDFVDAAIDDALGYGVTLDPELLRISRLNFAGGDTVRSISYDALGQVTAVHDSAFSAPTCGWSWQGWQCEDATPIGEVAAETFSYDEVGNRADQSASVTDGNRLTDFGSYEFTHDDEGRTLTKEDAGTGFLQTYHWNDRSQVDSVTTIDGADTTVVAYTYDALGRRISRDGPGGFEEYIYDGPHVIVVLDGSQDVLRSFSYYPGLDRPHSLMTDSATYYYATDPTGSVSGLAELTGASSAANQYRYDLWGNPQGTGTEAVDNPIRFKGRWWDEDTGLYDFRNRWYDPDISRFVSEDPIGLAGGINVYAFVSNNPVHGQDPFGLDPSGGPCDDPSVAPVHPEECPELESLTVVAYRSAPDWDVLHWSPELDRWLWEVSNEWADLRRRAGEYFARVYRSATRRPSPQEDPVEACAVGVFAAAPSNPLSFIPGGTGQFFGALNASFSAGGIAGGYGQLVASDAGWARKGAAAVLIPVDGALGFVGFFAPRGTPQSVAVAGGALVLSGGTTIAISWLLTGQGNPVGDC